MTDVSRRALLEGLGAAAALAAGPALAQGAPPVTPFRYEDVVRRARDLAGAPYAGDAPALPEALARLDFDAYREIRFRPDRALLAGAGSTFRMHLFHLGFLYTRPVTVNVIREGVPTPVPYQPQLFDFGSQRIERPLPVNVGFAGFRLHHPLNDPRVFDEVIAFLGASYFRFLGRGHAYGLSARGLALNVGREAPEEFPYFREFWIEMPQGGERRAVVHALLDSASVTGAYSFVVTPERQTRLDVTATLFPRVTLTGVGIAPLTSMFFTGETDRALNDDFRPELHDSDGLLMHSGSGEWIWRPLRNPQALTRSSFADTNPRGFGLMQRDRHFESYQDLEAHYHRRPGYWVEPQGEWGEGRVQLVEIPTRDETDDNVVAFWEPARPFEPNQEVVLSYRMRAVDGVDAMHTGGKAVNTYRKRAEASGSSEAPSPTQRRFLIDFAGGDLAFFLAEPSAVEIVPSASAGRILRTFVVPNPHIGGFRAAFDVELEAGQTADLRAYLRAGPRALTETWTMPWTAG